MRRGLSLLAFGALVASHAALAQTVKFVNPPTEVVLNDRHHPVTVAYQGAPGQADIHVDLLDGANRWVGGGMLTVNGNTGEAKVPIEVRIEPTYQGELTLRASLTNVGSQNRLAAPVDQRVRVSKVPTDAIGVLCQPQQVAPGQGFNLNLWFTQTHAKESDIVAVALHFQTKEYWGGFRIPISGQQGHVSGRFDLKWGNPDLPLKFKAWITPRGEDAPNYVSYTMIELPLGWNVNNDCPAIGNSDYAPNPLPADWVELVNVPGNLPRGANAPIGLRYSLVSEQTADLELALMTWNWDTHASDPITTTKVQITAASNYVTVDLPVPADAQPGKDGMYVIATVVPKGGSWEDKLAEDRKYKVAFGNGWMQPALRQSTNPEANGVEAPRGGWWPWRFNNNARAAPAQAPAQQGGSASGLRPRSPVAVQVEEVVQGLTGMLFRGVPVVESPVASLDPPVQQGPVEGEVRQDVPELEVDYAKAAGEVVANLEGN